MHRLGEAEGRHGPVDVESLLCPRIMAYCLSRRGGSVHGLRLLPCDRVGLPWVHTRVRLFLRLQDGRVLSASRFELVRFPEPPWNKDWETPGKRT